MDGSTVEGSQDEGRSDTSSSISSSPSYCWDDYFRVNGKRLQEEEFVLIQRKAGIWQVVQLKYPEDSDDDEHVVLMRYDGNHENCDVKTKDIRKIIVFEEVNPRMRGETR